MFRMRDTQVLIAFLSIVLFSSPGCGMGRLNEACCFARALRQQQSNQSDAAGIGRSVFEYEITMGDSVSALSFSPDGSVLAGATLSNRLALCDVKTGQEILVLTNGAEKPDGVSPNGHRVVALAFSHDGTILASAGDICEYGRLEGAEVRLWRVRLGKFWHSITIDTSKRAYTRSVALLPEGKSIITAVERDDRESKGEICEWDIETGGIKEKWLSVEKRVFSAALSPNGDTLALGFHGEIGFWDLKQARMRRADLDARYTGLSSSLSYSPDGNLIIGSYQGPIPLLAFV